MTQTSTSHTVVVPLSAWGHVRPLLHLALNLLVVHPGLHITFLIQPSVAERIQGELSGPTLAHLHDSDKQESTVLHRVQFIEVGGSGSDKSTANGAAGATVDDKLRQMMEYSILFPSFMTALMKGDTLPDERPNAFKSIQASSVIYDMFQAFVPASVTAISQALSRDCIPILCHAPCSAAANFHHFATAEHGGVIAHSTANATRLIAEGVEEMEAWGRSAYPGNGTLLEIPGLLPKYDYEFYPQLGSVPTPPGIMKGLSASMAGVYHPSVTALITPCVREFEPETHAATEKELGKPLLMAGLQFPQQVWDGVKTKRKLNDLEDSRVLEFLDAMQVKYGERSVAYLSFGSAWFPISRPELVLWIIDSLKAAEIPFVFAYGTELFPVPQSLVEAATCSTGCATKWAPQLAVLQHPATRFFISHCGTNSTAEAMITGVPLVAMPFAADQGEWTMLLERLGVAIDLKQVKTFVDSSFTKLYNGPEVIGTEKAIKNELQTVLSLMKGAESEKLRANMENVRSTAKTSYESGFARETMESLAQYF